MTLGRMTLHLYYIPSCPKFRISLLQTCSPSFWNFYFQLYLCGNSRIIQSTVAAWDRANNVVLFLCCSARARCSQLQLPCIQSGEVPALNRPKSNTDPVSKLGTPTKTSWRSKHMRNSLNIRYRRCEIQREASESALLSGLHWRCDKQRTDAPEKSN